MNFCDVVFVHEVSTEALSDWLNSEGVRSKRGMIDVTASQPACLSSLSS